MDGLAIGRESEWGGRVGGVEFQDTSFTWDDRLEPSVFVPDVGAVFSFATSPRPLTFWKVSKETIARHRRPLFCEELGTSVKRTLTIDGLHCIYLGVLNCFCHVVVWLFINAGVSL